MWGVLGKGCVLCLCGARGKSFGVSLRVVRGVGHYCSIFVNNI